MKHLDIRVTGKPGTRGRLGPPVALKHMFAGEKRREKSAGVRDLNLFTAEKYVLLALDDVD